MFDIILALVCGVHLGAFLSWLIYRNRGAIPDMRHASPRVRHYLEHYRTALFNLESAIENEKQGR